MCAGTGSPGAPSLPPHGGFTAPPPSQLAPPAYPGGPQAPLNPSTFSGGYAPLGPPSAFGTAYGVKSGPSTGFPGGFDESSGFPTTSGVMQQQGFNPNPLQQSGGYSLGGTTWPDFSYAPGVTDPIPHQIFDGTQPGTNPPPPGGYTPSPTLPGMPGIDPGFGGGFNRPPVFGTNPPPRGGPSPVIPRQSGPGAPLGPPGSTPVQPPPSGTRPPIGGVPKAAPTANELMMQAVLTGQGGGAYDPAQLNQYGPPQGGGQNWGQTLDYYKNNQARLNRQGPMYQPGGMFYDKTIDG
jgi:hypothetical protein